MCLRQGRRALIRKSLKILVYAAATIFLFIVYTWGISRNPPGFHVDESLTAYNAYLVSRTGAGEFGPRFPILFQAYAGSNPTYMNPLTIYLLAIVFRFVTPSIPVARTFAAFWMFAACLLLGVLARHISGQRKVCIVVAVTALVTPWLFEVGRLVFDAHLFAFTVVVFLLAAYSVQLKETWKWYDILMIAASLAAMTYGYASGRILAPAFALGLLFFATTKDRVFGVVKVWLAYGITLVPLILFNRSHPGVVTNRLWQVTYIRPDLPWTQIPSQFAEFVRCYLQDQSLTPLLLMGDGHWRHHVEDSGGAMLFSTFTLAAAGLLLIIVCRWRERWWRFVLYGLAVSIVPGAITDWTFHELRLMGYLVFLLVLTVPAVEWLLAPAEPKQRLGHTIQDGKPSPAVAANHGLPRGIRLGILAVLMAATVAQFVGFQVIFWRKGPERGYFAFDMMYKPAYDAAVAQPERPIYLENGQWGPLYIHAYWYAIVEGRPLSEFVRLADGAKPPAGAIVLSSNSDCQNCEVLKKISAYELYRAK